MVIYMAAKNFWINIPLLESFEEKRIQDLRNQGHLVQSKKLTKKSMVMIDSNGDSKEPTPVPSSGESAPVSKGSDATKNSAHPVNQPPAVDNENLAKSADVQKLSKDQEATVVETEEELSALFNPYLPIKMFKK